MATFGRFGDQKGWGRKRNWLLVPFPACPTGTTKCFSFPIAYQFYIVKTDCVSTLKLITVAFKRKHICIDYYCQARGPDHVQVNSRSLQGLKKLLVILRSQGLDQEIDSIIGRSHHHHNHPPGNFSESNNTVISS